MDIELVTVGTELLLGFTVDTNGAEIGRALAGAGVRVVRRTTVGDDAGRHPRRRGRGAGAHRRGDHHGRPRSHRRRHHQERRRRALRRAAPVRRRGLGRARGAVRPARAGCPPPTIAARPRCPRAPSCCPTAGAPRPGLWLEGAPGLVVMLPGVPRRDAEAARGTRCCRAWPTATPGGVIRSVTVRTTAIAESTLAERLGDIEERLAPLTLAYLPGLGSVDLRLTAWNLPADGGGPPTRRGRGPADRARPASTPTARATPISPRWCWPSSGSGGSASPWRSRAPAASSAARLTAVPGSSSQFWAASSPTPTRPSSGSWACPATSSRAEGAVSEPVARAMAIGAAREPRRRGGGVGHRHRRPGRRVGARSRSAPSGWGSSCRPGPRRVLRNLVGTREEIRGRAASSPCSSSG